MDIRHWVVREPRLYGGIHYIAAEADGNPILAPITHGSLDVLYHVVELHNQWLDGEIAKHNPLEG